MSKHAQLADGTVLEFPDDTTDAVMDRVVKQHIQAAVVPKPPARDMQTPGDVNAAQKLLADYKAKAPDDRNAAQVALDQYANVGKGALDFISHPIDNMIIGPAKTGAGIVRDIATGRATPSVNPLSMIASTPTAKTALRSMLNPVTTSAQGAGALVAPRSIQSPSREQFEQAAQGAGANAAGLLAGEAASEAAPYIARGAKSAADITLGARQPIVDILREKAAINKAKAVQPTTLGGKSDVLSVADEMAQRQMAPGIRGKTIDANIVKETEAAGARVGAVEDRLAQSAQPEVLTERSSLLSEIDKAMEGLNVKGTKVKARPEAVKNLMEIRGIFEQLPEQIRPETLIDLRRQLDQRAQDAGSYGPTADTLRHDINRGAADMVRGKANALDPELKIANHDYSVQRRAFDAVKRRQLGEVGQSNSGLPGRGGILDDVLAGWAGQALGGTAGGFIAEAANLGRQTRGWANLKANLESRLASSIEPPPPPPRTMIGSGATPLGGVQNSPINVTSKPWASYQGSAGKRTLGPGAIQTPYNPASELKVETPPWFQQRQLPQEAGAGITAATDAMGRTETLTQITEDRAVNLKTQQLYTLKPNGAWVLEGPAKIVDVLKARRKS